MDVFGYELIVSDHICAVVLLAGVIIIAAKFLPLNNSQRCAERVELCDLDVSRVLISRLTIAEAYSVSEMIAFDGCTRCYSYNSSKGIVIAKLNTHPHNYERNVPFLKTLHYKLLRWPV